MREKLTIASDVVKVSSKPFFYVSGNTSVEERCIGRHLWLPGIPLLLRNARSGWISLL